MKRFLISFTMATCIVGSLFAQETLDSLSYAWGDYCTLSVMCASERYLQTQADREAFLRGFQDELSIYPKDSVAYKSYSEGQMDGIFFLIRMSDGGLPYLPVFDMNCMARGLRKVADGTIQLPQDTIGYRLFEEDWHGLSAEDKCRYGTIFGILYGLYPRQSQFQPELTDSKDRQAYAAGMADILEKSHTFNSYDVGRGVAIMVFTHPMGIIPKMGLDFDYDAIIDGARGALELTERKMPDEEVYMWITQLIEELYFNDDIDDIIIEEEAAKEALYDFEVDGIYYLINGNEATVTHKDGNSPKNPCYSGELAIPATVTYNGVTYSVTSIGSHAFKGCRGLTSIEIPNSVTSIGNEAFSHCRGLSSVTIPNSVTTIDDWAFNECKNLTSIDIPNSVTSIGYAAFCESGLTSIIIPNSVTTIDDHAFSDCLELTSVSIGNSVSSIGEWAFNGCSSLTSIIIPNSVTSIGDSAFGSCSGLTSIVVESGNPTYDSRNNCNAIIETTSNELILGCMNSTIPNSITAIGSSAFSGCSGLTSIYIPNSVTTIGEYAFSSCRGLTSIDIPNSVTTIGGTAFYNCIGLTSVTIPNSVTTISDMAFNECSALKDVYSYIDNLSLVSMGSSVFYVYPAKYNKRTLHVPVGTLKAYQADTRWSEYFGNIVEMEP